MSPNYNKLQKKKIIIIINGEQFMYMYIKQQISFTNIVNLLNISEPKQENLHNHNIHLCVDKNTADPWVKNK